MQIDFDFDDIVDCTCLQRCTSHFYRTIVIYTDVIRCSRFYIRSQLSELLNQWCCTCIDRHNRHSIVNSRSKRQLLFYKRYNPILQMSRTVLSREQLQRIHCTAKYTLEDSTIAQYATHSYF